MMNLHIHEATPRYKIKGVKPFSYTIVFSDWRGMIWWDDGHIQNEYFPLTNRRPNQKDEGD